MLIPLSIERAANPEPTAVQNVGINHRRGHVAVAEEFLDGSDVLAGLEQVGREGVPERVARRGYGDPGSAHGLLHRPLEDRFVQVVATGPSCLGVNVRA